MYQYRSYLGSKLEMFIVYCFDGSLFYLYGQAYTIELEAEVNHWKVENAHLEHRLVYAIFPGHLASIY